MIKDIDPVIPLTMGFLFLGVAVAYTNPSTRTLFAQRQQSQQLREAARIESQNTEAMQIIAATRQGCTRVAQVNTTAVYKIPTGTAICDGSVSAIIGSDGRPTLLAQVKP